MSTMSASPVKPVMPPPPSGVPAAKVIPPSSSPTSNATATSLQNPVAASPPKNNTSVSVTPVSVTSTMPSQNNSPSKQLQQNMNHAAASAVPLSLITTDHKNAPPPSVQAVPATVQPLIMNRASEKQSSNSSANLKPTSNGVEGQPNASAAVPLTITPVVQASSQPSGAPPSSVAQITAIPPPVSCPLPMPSSHLPPSVTFTPINIPLADVKSSQLAQQQKQDNLTSQPQSATAAPQVTAAQPPATSTPSVAVPNATSNTSVSASSSSAGSTSVGAQQHSNQTGLTVSPVKLDATSHLPPSVTITPSKSEKVNADSSGSSVPKSGSGGATFYSSAATPVVLSQTVHSRPTPAAGSATSALSSIAANSSITITKTGGSQSTSNESSPSSTAALSSSPSTAASSVSVTSSPHKIASTVSSLAATSVPSSGSDASTTQKQPQATETVSPNSGVPSTGNSSASETSKPKSEHTTPAVASAVPSTTTAAAVSSSTPPSSSSATSSAKPDMKVATIPRSKRKRETKPPAVQASKVATPIPQGQGASSSSENESADDRKSKRVRLPTQPYQSPLPEFSLIAKMNKATPTKASDDKLIVFYKNEFLAVRNAEGGFYICQAMQNIYKSSPRIRIRWLSQEASTEVYSPDFYDTTDFDCILTNLNMERVEKEKFRLPPVELQRTESILKRALDVEKGVSEKPSVTEEHPDGLDLSLFRDESQLKKTPKKGSAGTPAVKRSVKKSPRSSRSTSEVQSESEETAVSSEEKKKKKESTPSTAAKTNKKKKKQSAVKKKSVPPAATVAKKTVTKTQTTTKAVQAKKKKKKAPVPAAAPPEQPARTTTKRKRSTSVPPPPSASSGSSASSAKRARKTEAASTEKTEEKSSKTRSTVVATPAASKNRSAAASVAVAANSGAAETTPAASTTTSSSSSSVASTRNSSSGNSNATSTAASAKDSAKDNHNREQRRASKNRAANK